MISPVHEPWHAWRVLVVVLLLAESDGLISSIIGMDDVISGWLYSALVLALFAIALVRFLMVDNLKQTAPFFYPLVVCGIIIVVSAGSAVIFPKSLGDWLPSLYVFAPLLLFYSFYLFRVTEIDVAVSLILLAAVVSILVVFDHLSPLPFLDEYTRASVFLDEHRRIVLLKNEVVFGIIVCLALLMGDQLKPGRRLKLVFLLAIMIFAQVAIMESRLAWLAIGVGFILILHQYGFAKKRVFVYGSVAAVVAIVAGLTVFNRQMLRILEMLGGGIYQEGANISVRVESVMHYFDVYLESYGWGIGMMSATGRSNNVLHSSSFYIADIGALSTIFQFGVLGLFVWIWLNYACFKGNFSEIRKRKVSNNTAVYMPVAANGLLAGFTVSVLPLSLFTQPWTISVGAILLYLLWLYSRRSIGS